MQNLQFSKQNDRSIGRVLIHNNTPLACYRVQSSFKYLMKSNAPQFFPTYIYIRHILVEFFVWSGKHLNYFRLAHLHFNRRRLKINSTVIITLKNNRKFTRLRTKIDLIFERCSDKLDYLTMPDLYCLFSGHKKVLAFEKFWYTDWNLNWGTFFLRSQPKLIFNDCF